jgi:hypothetical protein
MKKNLLFAALLASASFAFADTESTRDGCCAAEPNAAKTSATAAAQAGYPLDTCVVSGEKLGEMGAPVDYIYKEDGKPDRLVRLCCKMCIAKFKKDPAKFLKLLDEAANKKPANTGTMHDHM